MASIIENTLYAPRINPFRLDAARGNTCASKYAPGDTTSFQLVSRGNVFEGYCNIYSKRGVPVSSIAPVVTTLNGVYNFYTFNITMPDSEGCYDIELGGVLNGIGHSNWGKAEIRKEHAELTQLQYFNSYNAFDVNFGLGCRFMLRTEGGFYPNSYQPKRQDTVYQDQDTSFVLLKSRVHSTMRFYAGGDYGISNDEIDIINRAWACDNVFVNGKQYTVYEEASWEERSEDGYPNRTWTIEVTEAGNGGLAVFEITMRMEWGNFVCLEQNTGEVTDDALQEVTSVGTTMDVQLEGSYTADNHGNYFFVTGSDIIVYSPEKGFSSMDLAGIGMPAVGIRYIVYDKSQGHILVSTAGSGVWRIQANVATGYYAADRVSALQTVSRMVVYDRFVYIADMATGLHVMEWVTNMNTGQAYYKVTLLMAQPSASYQYLAVEQPENSNTAYLYYSYAPAPSSGYITSGTVDMSTGSLVDINSLVLTTESVRVLFTSYFNGYSKVYVASREEIDRLEKGYAVFSNLHSAVSLNLSGYPNMELPNDGSNVFVTDFYNIYVNPSGGNEWQTYTANPNAGVAAVNFISDTVIYSVSSSIYFGSNKKLSGITGTKLYKGSNGLFIYDIENDRFKYIILVKGGQADEWETYGRAAATGLQVSHGEGNTATTSVLNAFGAFAPVSGDDYARLTEDMIIERQNAFIAFIAGINNYTLLNSGVINSDVCKPDTGEVGYVFTATPLTVTFENGEGMAFVNVVSTLNGNEVQFTETHGAYPYMIHKVSNRTLQIINGGSSVGWEDTITLYQKRQDGTYGIIEITVKNIADTVSDALFHDGYMHPDNYLYTDSYLIE